jgi:hypothetical protein
MIEYPSWILRNYLIGIGISFHIQKFNILCIREELKDGKKLNQSIIINVMLPETLIPEKLNFVGWEKDENEKNKSRVEDLSFLFDPVKLSESSVSLNLELMKWRMFTSLNTLNYFKL